MVKVCHLSTVHSRRDVRILYKECFSLSQAGYKVHLLIADGKGDEDFMGIKIHGCPKYCKRIHRMLFSPLQILIKAIQINADLYHFHDMELLPVGLLLRILGHKVIYDVHDNLPKQIMGKHYIAKPLRQILALLITCLEAGLSPLMSAIITADRNKEKRFSRYHSLVRTVHNYPLLEELTLLSADSRKPGVICYIGGITKIRGIIPLLDAIRNIDVKLILAGLFEPPTLEAECRAHPSWEKVDYRGYANRKGVAVILSTSSIGMVNLLPNENYLDSLPIKMFEYMSAGMPVIASNFPDWEAIVSKYNCGLCIDPLKTTEISQAIQYLLDNPVLGAQMGARGHQAIIEELNWSGQAEILSKLYHEVLQT